MSHIAVDVVSEIERRGACRQINHIPFRGKDVDAIVKDLTAHFVEHFARVSHLFLPRNQLTQPGDTILVTRATAAGGPLFIFPVRRHAQLGVFVHLFGTDLNFHRFAARAEHHGMNRLIAIRLRVRDVVIELIRQMAEVSMYYPQRGVAVLETLRHDTHGAHVKQLVKGEMFLLHFAPDAVDVLRTPVNLSAHILLFHRLAQPADEFLDIVLTVNAAFVQQFCDAFVFRRMQVAEAVIFQLPLQLPDTETVRQRRIDIRTLFGGQDALVFRRIFHFAQMGNPFGQLDNHAAEIIYHRQQHTTDVIHLLGRDRIRLRGF